MEPEVMKLKEEVEKTKPIEVIYGNQESNDDPYKAGTTDLTKKVFHRSLPTRLPTEPRDSL